MEGEISSTSSQNAGKSERTKRGINCVAYGCSNTTNDGVKLHKFPWSRNAKLARQWEKRVATKRAHWKATKWSHICSRHFTDESFTSSSRTRRRFDPTYQLVLENDAVTTIFVKAVKQGTSQQDPDNQINPNGGRKSRSKQRSVMKLKVGGAFRKRERARVLGEVHYLCGPKQEAVDLEETTQSESVPCPRIKDVSSNIKDTSEKEEDQCALPWQE